MLLLVSVPLVLGSVAGLLGLATELERWNRRLTVRMVCSPRVPPEVAEAVIQREFAQVADHRPGADW